MKKIIITGTLCAFLNHFANATSSHDNKVCFTEPISNESLTGYSVTPGQPFNTNIELTDESKCLVIDAGRKSSESTVEWVKSTLAKENLAWKSNNMLHLGASIDGVPDKLNFAVRLNLTFNGVTECDNVILGQGSNDDGLNNWWMFLNDPKGNDSLFCTYFNNVEFLLINPGMFNDYTFKFSEV